MTVVPVSRVLTWQVFSGEAEENMTTSMRSNTLGGLGGASFDDSHNIDAWGRINQIVVRHGSEVDSIGIGYANGNFVSHGGNGGNATVINIAPGEFISKVEGRSGDRVDQITFHSNRQTYGPFGGGGGQPFAVDFGGKALHYMFGRSGSEMDQIGFGFGDLPPALPTTITRSTGHGGNGGSPFDDLAASGAVLGKITGITIRHGDRIDNIAVDYGGASSVAHGGGGGQLDRFDLGDDEWITEIHGRSGSELDQVQFFLNSGRVSPVYGGNGGSPFTEAKPNCVIEAFFGRSGSEIDQLGVYFSEARPTSIEIIEINYDVSRFNVLAIPPIIALETFLTNDTSIQQQLTQNPSITISDTSSTSITETNEVSVSLKTSADFLITGADLTVGYKNSVAYTTGQSHTETYTTQVNFAAMVPAKSQVKAICIVRKGQFDVPWTATAQVTYQNRSPQTTTLHGTLTGVGTTAVETQYEQVI